MSMWNKLAHGSPVTFEMRWKGRPDSTDAAQWTFCSCLPIFDENKSVIGVGGNIIDINAQKKSHDATQARLDAVEQARLSELKFARFAQLAPIAIYIYVPNTGQCKTRCRVLAVPTILTASQACSSSMTSSMS